ncbi:MAG TPA: S8 family serine peptidase [Thermoleophilaceae bacterium]
MRSFGRGPLVALLAALVFAVPAYAADHGWPGSDTGESVRAHTPDDPGFDCAEPDDQDGGTCTNVWDEQTQRFGFAPSATQNTATYGNDASPATKEIEAQNAAAGRNAKGQASGVSADRAWKFTAGDPRVKVAILDTGIRWEDQELVDRIALNRGELPLPQGCTSYDCNGDGAFNVEDYAHDARVPKTAGDDAADSILDPSDLIAAFSDGVDSDHNGYVDDIAGWDFFNDDNDPFDQSSYSSANNHGSGRAEDAAEEGNDGQGGIGVCPHCQILPMRVWDTFVVDTNNFAEAVTYAADDGAKVVEGAVGGLFNSRFAREAFAYAYSKGTLPVLVSSDLNTGDHNFPTDYDQSLFVAGTVADTQGAGSELPDCGGGASFCQTLEHTLQTLGFGTNVPVGTWFRNSGTTQYGGHAHIVMPAVTGSEATGQASGAAGLLQSEALGKGTTLAPNEIKQLLTMTAEDVVPENTRGIGVPDPSQYGWDQHFGYGRPDLALAMEKIAAGKIPPQALITSPDWFAPLNVSQRSTVQIGASLSAPRASGYTWKLQWAPGIEPCESDFRDVGSGSGSAPRTGALGTLDLRLVRTALDSRKISSSCPNLPQPVTGGSTPDPTAPAKGPGDVDPNEPAFTVRVVVTDSEGNRGEDRKVLFDYRDTTLHPGWSKALGTGGEASERLFDLNGDNKLDLVLADSSGELHVLNADGTPLASFNGGQPVRTQTYSNVHAGAPVYGSLAPPREVLRTPAIGDIDGDMEPEIVDSAGEHIYAWHEDGTPVAGFPVRVDPVFSQPADESKQNHVKRGFAGSPTLADLNGDGRLDIVIPALDQHLYAWDGSGHPLPGFPMKLKSPGEDLVGAESINSAAAGDINGDGNPEVVAPTNELGPGGDASEPTPAPGNVAGAIGQVVTNALANAIGATGRVYAVDHSGHILSGWPIKPGGLQPDALPFVGPGVDHVLADVNGDGKLDVIGNVATGDVTAVDSTGKQIVTYDSQPAGGDTVDKTKVLNLFENPIVAKLDGQLDVIKGGITLDGLVNVGIAVGQNLPYNHVVQAWNAQTGQELPAFPQAVEDYQLLSSPAVADVSDAPGNEILVGTGMYLMRDINAQGIEGSGWPKFTGGWNFAVPAIGDVDGDGKLEVTGLTREGNAFLWDTDRPACGTNDEWWTSRHDEFGSGAYGTDSRPPGTATGLNAAKAGGSQVTLSWKAPGGDWMCGAAKRYRVIASSKPIAHPRDGSLVGTFDSSGGVGSAASQTFKPPAGAKYVAVLYQDAAGNWGHLASTKLS